MTSQVYSSVGDLNVGTVELDYTQTRRLISQPVQLHRAHESIFKPLAELADHMKSELDEAAGDVRATWWTAQKLLHSRAVTIKVVYDDAQCAPLVSTFCQFFVDKVSVCA